MKKMLPASLLLVAILAHAAETQPSPAAPPAGPPADLVHRTAPNLPPPAAKPDPLAELTKERDDAKAALASLQAQQQQNAIAVEYFKAAAERNDNNRNEALLALVQMKIQLTAAQNATGELQRQLEELKAKTPAKP